MNKLLTRQCKWLVITLFLEAAILGTLVVLYYYFPNFDYYFIILLAVSSVFVLFDATACFFFNYFFKKKKGQTELRACDIMGNDISEAYNFGLVGLAVCDHEDNVIWVNDFLGSRFKNMVDKRIFDVFPGLYVLSDSNYSNKTAKITVESHVYSVEFLKEAKLYVFKDITEVENLNTFNKNQSPVIGYICIDNYSDVQMSIGDENKFADVISELRKKIAAFGDESKSMMRRIKDSRYLFITTMENYELLLKDKFSIVDSVRKDFAEKGGFTLSLGVAYGFPEFKKLSELASNALDVALSRGGDQTVIQPFSKQMIYIGGKTELQPSRNRVKLRTLSNSFLTILKSYKNVIIMPHTMADFDAIGSALGVYLLCKCEFVNVPAKICWDEQLIEAKARKAVEGEFTKAEMNETFISMKEVDSLDTEETLLVCVDHNNPDISIFKNQLNKFSHIAIVDHHRPTSKTFDSPEFNCVDTSASSASELITFFINYNQNKILIDGRTATFLLSGICLDTRFFREHATTNTFEASARLKDYNGDIAKVSEYMEEEYEEYKQKISILNNAETPSYGCLVCTSPDKEIVSRTILAISGDEAVSIQGISVCFVIGRTNEHEVSVSARSDGSVSVQLLVEKLGYGGGGHLKAAAAQAKNSTVEEVKAKVLAVLKDYLKDASVNVGEKEEK